MKIAFSWDDGAPEDLKLFKLHEKYEIPGMFFIPTRNREGRAVLSEQDLRRAKSDYVTFGGHTQNHIYLTELSYDKIENEVIQNKQFLENCLSEEIRHFCLPGGKYNREILNLIRKHYFTIRTADTMNFKWGVNGVFKPTFHFYPRGIKSLIGNSIRNNNGKYISLIMKHRNETYFDIIKRIIEQEANRDNLIMIWGHSWEVEKYQLWKILESFFRYVKNSYSDMILNFDDLESISIKNY